MDATRLLRFGAWAAFLGGLILIVPDAIAAVTGSGNGVYTGSTLEQIGSVLFLIGKVLLIPGTVSLYLYQSGRAGTFGFVAFVLALTGTAMMIGSDWMEVFMAPVLHSAAPALMDELPTRLIVGFLLNYGLETLGWLLFGIATLRAGVFPRPAALALIVAVLVPLVGPGWIFMLWNATIVFLGWTVLRRDLPERSIAPVPA